MIMYWIQREWGLIPIAVACNRKEFLGALDTQSYDALTTKERKKRFRLFMRKLLDSHLKEFARKARKGCEENEIKTTSRDRILELIKDKPTHTAKTMASALGLSVQAVQKQLAILKTEKRIERIGPDHGGSWKIISSKSPCGA